MARIFSLSLSGFAAVVLLVLVSAHSLVAHLDQTNPAWALTLRDDAGAELAIAQSLIGNAGGHAENNIGSPQIENSLALRMRLRKALYFEPLNTQAFALLGVLSASGGDSEAATTFMQAALSRSKRSPAALYWIMHRELDKGDVAESSALADILLRIRPTALPLVAPTLAQISMRGEGRNAVADALARAPLWRTHFFSFMNSELKYADISLRLLLALKKSPHPPTEQEVDSFLASLTTHGRYALAYYAWLQFLPPERLAAAKFLFNGTFRFPLTASPFDWKIRGGDGVIAEIDKSDDAPGKNTLSIEFGGGGMSFNPISQALVIPPRRYRFSGFAKGELEGPRGLKWQVACISPVSSKSLADTPMMQGRFADWTEFSTIFDIPADCHAQTVRLILDARSLSDTFISGTIAFADLRISRD
ncbi:MAG: hypothetical protein JSR99_17405 [Proteobacteria bacterium]|nr:hypothetical protein [Pseudomonadota bacterium]